MAPNRVTKTPPVILRSAVASLTVMFYPSALRDSNRVTVATPLWESAILGFTYRRLYRRPRAA